MKAYTDEQVIAGVLYDFMGWLTTRKERLVLSFYDNASPAVDAVVKFAATRNLSLDDPAIEDWNATLRSGQVADRATLAACCPAWCRSGTGCSATA